MKKYFTLNVGLNEFDYLASNEQLNGAIPVMVLDKVYGKEINGDAKHHASVLLAIPIEVREAVSDENPKIYIYNAKDITDGHVD